MFPDNDRPGILLAGAAQTYLNKYGVKVGNQVGVFTSCDSAYAAAFDLAETGVEIPVIVDHRESVSKELQKQADELGIKIMTGAHVSGTAGKLRVNTMCVEKNENANGHEEFEVDALITCAGWTLPCISIRNPVASLNGTKKAIASCPVKARKTAFQLAAATAQMI